VPDGLADRLRSALDKEDASRRSRPPHGTLPPAPRLIAWAAAGAVLFGLGFLSPRVLSARASEPDIANPAQIHGRLTCIGCEIERAEQRPGALMAASGAGRHVGPHDARHLRTADGRLWELVADGEAATALPADRAGSDVMVFGAAYPDVNAIRVSRITSAP
jgi:hypothetical protein